MSYENEATPPTRNNFRIGLGVLMVAFSAFRLYRLLGDLPGVLARGDSSEMMVYGAVPALIVIVFFIVGVRIARQGYYGIEKPKREK